MKEFEEEKLNENEEMERIETNYEDIEMIELSEEEENVIEGGATIGEYRTDFLELYGAREQNDLRWNGDTLVDNDGYVRIRNHCKNLSVTINQGNKRLNCRLTSFGYEHMARRIGFETTISVHYTNRKTKKYDTTSIKITWNP